MNIGKTNEKIPTCLLYFIQEYLTMNNENNIRHFKTVSL